MRHTHWVALSLVSIAGAAASSSVGCFSTADNCEDSRTCEPSDTTTGTTTTTSTGMGGTGGTGGTGGAGGVGGAGGTGGVGGTGGTGGTGGGPLCTVEPSQDPTVLREECGIFVALGGVDDAAGSPTAPVRTLAKAIELAAADNKRVYACAEGFQEVVVLDVGVTIYGGLGCAEFATMPWTYVDENSRTDLRAMPGEIPLTLNAGANGAYIEAFAIEAEAGTAPGGSSIAVVANGVTATMTRCEIVAKNGANGAPGESPPLNDAALDGTDGADGVSTCMAGVNNPGPAGPVKVCSTGGMSAGGKGGDGGLIDVGPPPVLFPAGNGSSGTTGTMGMFGSGEDAADCTPGMNGSPGMAGASAAGGVTIGTIAATGYTGANGQNGTAGQPAQGGGGGGGAKGGLLVQCAIAGDRVGSSGGTGGTGGCGGLPGNGGAPGGSSIALISLGAMLTLTDVTLTAGQGGDGGNGGNAQNGGAKGDKGALSPAVTPTNASCAGGDGGVGGKGGPGGGGAGGHSLGIAYTGMLPVATMVTTMTPGNGGNGGMGNNNPANNGAGIDGLEQDSLDFQQ